ncbi:type II secretion system F family protein [Psychromicrobium sp. YIM B11713]|uniref:type II secretion system F family protein n=1 Tax=Psychromicrobium sp. YIM B11713 TaxID=3145233 RepID=UPI00374F848F
MAAILGLALGIGLFMVWWSCWSEPWRGMKLPGSQAAEQLLRRAGIENLSVSGLYACSLILGLLCLFATSLICGSWSIACCLAVLTSWLPIAALRTRARRRSAKLRQLWPDVLDHLRSAVRAGLGLPEALIQLAEKGPAELRESFGRFASDYRAGSHFDVALDRLKAQLADPSADRMIEALRLTREVGGSELGRLLGTLSQFLRESLQTRAELEARQSWTVNAARLAVAAPWLLLLVLSTQPKTVEAYNSGTGWMLLGAGLVVSAICYRLMLRIGALPEERRILR